MAVAYVSAQSTIGTSSGTVSTFTITLPNAITSGASLVILAGATPSSGSASTWSLSDNKSNTYTRDKNQVDVDGFGTAGFYGINIQGGPTTLTFTTSSGTVQFGALLVLCFTGISIVSPFDASAINSQTSPGTGTNAITSGSFSPGTSGDLIVAITVDVAGLGGDTHGTGFTAGVTDSVSYFSEYKLSGVSGAQAGTFTNATNGGNAGGLWDTWAIALKAAVPTTLSPPQQQWAWVGNAPALNHGLQTVQKAWQWVGNAPSLTSNTNLQTVQKQWQWVANVPTISIGLLLLPPQKAWAWLAHAPALNTALQTVQKAWAWIPHAPTISRGLQTVQKAWVWLAQAPTLIPSTIINPPKALWAWVARAPVFSGGNIPGHIRHGFNVMRGVMWGVLSGIDRGEMR